MKRLILLGHLGLGDHVIANGLVRVLLKDYEHIEIITKRHNAATVGWMFSDTGRVSCLCVENDDEARKLAAWEETKGQKVLRLGVHRSADIPQDWDAWFYRQANVPFECRWREFKLPEPKPLLILPPCAFLHDDKARGYNIRPGVIRSPLSIYFPWQTDPFSKHTAWLAACHEIHVIDSCFLALADSIGTNATRHVLHLYATAHDPYKKFGPPTLRKNWEILR